MEEKPAFHDRRLKVPIGPILVQRTDDGGWMESFCFSKEHFATVINVTKISVTGSLQIFLVALPYFIIYVVYLDYSDYQKDRGSIPDSVKDSSNARGVRARKICFVRKSLWFWFCLALRLQLPWNAKIWKLSLSDPCLNCSGGNRWRHQSAIILFFLCSEAQ